LFTQLISAPVVSVSMKAARRRIPILILGDAAE
jgi:hypothetical protein